MSNGAEEPDDHAAEDDAEPADDTSAPDDSESPDESTEEAPAESDQEDAIDYQLDVETFNDRLEDVTTALEDAETEADLDEVEATLDAIGEDLEAADLPDADDEDEPDPAEELSDRLAELREQLEDKRGPYAHDVTETIDATQESLRDTRWTDSGEATLTDAVEHFVSTVNDELDAEIDPPSGEPEDLADGLDPVATAIGDADLDPDADAETLTALVQAVEEFASSIDDAEEWDDLSVREQLQAQGFYDSLDEKHKDFPPEWTALKEWENEGNAEMILLALEAFDSDFMERHCLESLERMGPEEAVDSMLERADRRDKPAIRILGKIGDPRDDVVDTLTEFVGTESDPALQKVTMKALGEMGAHDAVQAIADQLVVETNSVRSRAARALGLLGDPRAISPLASVLEEDEDDSVRASAAWALVQIGTEDALTEAAEYATDRAYVVAAEATPAATALGDDADAPTA